MKYVDIKSAQLSVQLQLQHTLAKPTPLGGLGNKKNINVICLPTENTKEFTKTRSKLSVHSQIELEFGTFIGIEILTTS